MSVRKINESTLTAIGNAIRGKTGGSALINPEDMADEIESIETGGVSDIESAEGEFTVTETNKTSIAIPHGLSKTPFLVSVYPKDLTASVGTNRHVVGGITLFAYKSAIQDKNALFAIYSPIFYGSGKVGWYTETNSVQNALAEGSGANYVKDVDSTKFWFASSASYPIMATTYVWKAYAFK